VHNLPLEHNILQVWFLNLFGNLGNHRNIHILGGEHRAHVSALFNAETCFFMLWWSLQPHCLQAVVGHLARADASSAFLRSHRAQRTVENAFFFRIRVLRVRFLELHDASGAGDLLPCYAQRHS